MVAKPGAGEVRLARRVRRLPDPPGVRLARPAPRPRPGPGQQRRDHLRPVRDPGARQLREPHLRRRPGRLDLRPVPAPGQRLAASRDSGRPTTSSSPRPGSRPTARSNRPRIPPCCTTGSWSTTTPRTSARWPSRQPTLQGPRTQGADRPPGPRTPGQVPQHLGPRDQGLRRALNRRPVERRRRIVTLRRIRPYRERGAVREPRKPRPIPGQIPVPPGQESHFERTAEDPVGKPPPGHDDQVARSR